MSCDAQVYVPGLQHVPKVCLRVHLPSDYPSCSAPIPEVHGPHLSDGVKAWVVAELESQFNAGKSTYSYIWVFPAFFNTCCTHPTYRKLLAIDGRALAFAISADDHLS